MSSHSEFQLNVFTLVFKRRNLVNIDSHVLSLNFAVLFVTIFKVSKELIVIKLSD